MKQLVIYGASEFGKVVKTFAESSGSDVRGFIDDWHSGADVVGGCETLLREFSPQKFDIAMAIGYRHQDERWNIYCRLKNEGYRFPALVHPRAIVDPTASVADGVFIMAGAIVDARATIEPLAVAWPGAIVNHDSTIGTNTFLGPGAIVCGRTSVGHGCFIGAGAVVTDHLIVPPKTFIKAADRYSDHKTSGT